MAWLLRVALALLVGVGLPARAADTALTLKDWASPGLIQSMTMSPDGKRIAGIGGVQAGTVFVTELDTGQARVVARWEADHRYRYGSRPVAVHWITDDLLAVDYSIRESVSIDLAGTRIAKLGERFIRRLNERGEASSWVLAYREIDDGEIDAVNARNGERRSYRVALPGKLSAWAFDAAGALLAVQTMDTAYWSEKTKVSNWYRPDEEAPWQRLQEGPITGELWYPLRVLPEPGMLAVLSRHDRDTWAVFRYDTRKQQIVDLMAGHPTEDILAVNGLDQPSFERVITAGMKTRIYWFDARWAALQAGVDAALPGRINLMQGDRNGRILVFSYGDVDPGRWFLLDTASSGLREIGQARPRIDPARMRPMEIVRYTARDGLDIPAYLTRPAGSADTPGPMVVLIHGGPQVRDRWEWNDEVQLLASKGYIVFQPQFRGSSGFGRRFEEAGYQQWGRSMQDDITDGVEHLIATKVADPRRICIYGASYGGYAALWGVIRTPRLYRCGLSFAGVSDLNDQLSNNLADDSTAASRELNRARVGDPARSRQALADVSPLHHAARVEVPLFIAHGEEDTRVLPAQSKAMVKALQALGKPVEWMPFPGEGHGFGWVANQVKYYGAVLDFLNRHIGEPPAAPAAGSDPPRAARD